MTLSEQIVGALTAAQNKPEPLVDPRASRTWQTKIQQGLGGPVEEITRYPGARSYCYDRLLPAEETDRWRTVLRIRISGVGPYATNTFMQFSNQDQWWSGVVRTSRSGFSPEHADALQRLRAWYAENGVTEVDQEIQSLPSPPEIHLAVRKGESPTLFEALFGQ